MPPAVRSLDVVIPTVGRPDRLHRTLTALDAQTVDGFQTIVVADGTDAALPEELPGDPRVLVQEHAGAAAARNRGVAAGDGELVLFLGDDMIPAPDLVEGHLAAHDAHRAETTAVLGHVDWHPGASGGRLLRWLDWSGIQFDYRQLAGRGGEDVGFGRFYTANVSLPRALFEAVGGFDQDHFIVYYEDIDLGYRLAQVGMELRYAPDARVYHLHDYTLAGLRRRFEGTALSERFMHALHDWFTPYFHHRVSRAVAHPPVREVWTRLVDLAPRGTRLRDALEWRADRWYLQQLGPAFLAAWERAAEAVELSRYLGADFELRKLVHHRQTVAREAAAVGDEERFYRTSEGYLYDLTAFSMSGTKDPYREELRRHVAPGASLLDYGCGIGSDGLALLEDGYRVAFADFDNPSTAYLRWRLDQRGLEAPLHDLDRDAVPSGFDAAYAFDVIEHVPDPVAFLTELERRAELVVVNLLEDDPDDGHDHEALHRELPIAELVDRAAARGLVSHTVHHGRSHLLLYRGSAQRVSG